MVLDIISIFNNNIVNSGDQHPGDISQVGKELRAVRFARENNRNCLLQSSIVYKR